MLLIEDDHYKQLLELINKFEQFRFGKQKLIDLSNKSSEEIKTISQAEAEDTITQNLIVKKSYDKLLMTIGKSFRRQIKG